MDNFFGLGVSAEGGFVGSVRRDCEGPSERADAIPHDLHANANEKKRREAQDDAHAAIAHHRSEAVGKAVAHINAEGDNRCANHRRENCQQIGPQMVWQVGA